MKNSNQMEKRGFLAFEEEVFSSRIGTSRLQSGCGRTSQRLTTVMMFGTWQNVCSFLYVCIVMCVVLKGSVLIVINIMHHF